MEKLQPFLKQRYWICFGLALIFILVGWWSASGDLAAKTEVRKKSVDDSFSSADKGKTDPNKDWVAGGKKENDLDSGSYKTASLQLWKRQQAAREWPEQIRSEMQKIAYFADVNSKETRERWVSIYEKQIEDLLKIVQPFQPDTGEGLVVVDANRITKQPFNKWQIDYPSSNEIWSNQEDIWLLKALLTSISKTNESATRITESQVPEIKQLTLRGGDRKTKPGTTSGGGMGGMGGGGKMGSGGMGGAEMGSLGMGGDGGMGGMSGAGGGGAASHSHPGTAFEGSSGGDLLTEEFGAVAGAGGGMGGFGSLGGSEGAMMSGMGSPKSGSGAGPAASTKEVRYVDDAEKDQGYKTRAFLLDVLIRDDRLPDLLAKLTNSDFPVEIVRVEIKSRSVGGGGGMSGGYGGGEGMSGGYGGGEGMSGGYGGGEGMSGGYGSGSMSGGGVGMLSGESLGGMAGGSGKGGGMSPGIGGGGGIGGSFSGLGGMQGEGGYSGEGSGTGMMGVGAASGTDALNAAMADPLLIDVRIGGLLTLYMTPEEILTQAKTEEAAAKEAEKSAPATAVPGATETPAAAVPGASETPAATVPGASETPATAVPGASETPATAVPGASVPDASAVGPTAVGGVPGQSLSSQGADPKPAGDGTPAVSEGENVPPDASPPGTPIP